MGFKSHVDYVARYKLETLEKKTVWLTKPNQTNRIKSRTKKHKKLQFCFLFLFLVTEKENVFKPITQTTQRYKTQHGQLQNHHFFAIIIFQRVFNGYGLETSKYWNLPLLILRLETIILILFSYKNKK